MQMHEQEISGIKENTNNINGAKYLMKKIALKKIYNKLQSLGIKCSYSEIKFQDMDLRKFPLDDNYDIVTKQNLEFQNAIDLIPKDFLALIKEYLIASRIINGIRIKKLKSKLRKLDIQFKDIKQHINADIHQLQLANVAFNNVARIYETVSETLAPMVDDILDQIHHNLNDITEDQQKSLLLMKDILKDFSEKSLEFGNETNFISNVINYNNSLSKKYLDFIDVLKHTA
jgi:gas vesicle protein